MSDALVSSRSGVAALAVRPAEPLPAPPPLPEVSASGVAAASFEPAAGVPAAELPPLTALGAHLCEQPWFEGQGPLRSMRVVSTQDLPVAGAVERFVLATVEVQDALGMSDVYLMPLRLSPGAPVASALADARFRCAVVEQVESGRFAAWTPGLVPTPVEHDGARVDLQALEASLVSEGLTTPLWFAHVVQKARELAPRDAEALVEVFFDEVRRGLQTQSPQIRAFHLEQRGRPLGPLLYGYAQYMAVRRGEQTSTFDDLAAFLDVAMKRHARYRPADSQADVVPGFGFQHLELMPVCLSAWQDGGYDVQDFFRIDPLVGGDAAHQRFMAELVERGGSLVTDLVANHVSYEHEWIVGLRNGDAAQLPRIVRWNDAVKVGERDVGDKRFNVFLHLRGEHAGKVSHVWQIFPDNNPDTLVPFEVDGRVHQGFASFMNPDQVDVNVQDPEVLAHHLRVVAHYAALGHRGVRLDAVIHAVKQPGTDNINLPQTRALAALVKAFAHHVAPGTVVVPEANVPFEEARAHWFEPDAHFEDGLHNLHADATVSFWSHQANVEALLTQDKRPWLKAQELLGVIPPHKTVLNYLGLHDETLVPNVELRERLVAEGCTSFADRGVGDSLMTLLKDPRRMQAALVLLYAGKGTPAVYYRQLVGAANDVAFYEEQGAQRLAAQAERGEPLDRAKAFDARDLDRGPVQMEQYVEALRSGFLPAVTVRALNALWETRSAVRSDQVVEVPSEEVGVVTVARAAEPGHDEGSLLTVVNLTPDEKTVRLEAGDLKRLLGWAPEARPALRDVLGEAVDAQGASTVHVRWVPGGLELRVAPYAAWLLEPR